MSQYNELKKAYEKLKDDEKQRIDPTTKYLETHVLPMLITMGSGSVCIETNSNPDTVCKKVPQHVIDKFSTTAFSWRIQDYVCVDRDLKDKIVFRMRRDKLYDTCASKISTIISSLSYVP